jgi:hypothetical protein
MTEADVKEHKQEIKDKVTKEKKETNDFMRTLSDPKNLSKIDSVINLEK